ncbi:MAG: hypothetical protein NZZ41_05525 [Candidatus Dojkabacteria bacterium]|nr:hypothetical protein [Candidatus Dojkabacteria bacterium]
MTSFRGFPKKGFQTRVNNPNQKPAASKYEKQTAFVQQLMNSKTTVENMKVNITNIYRKVVEKNNGKEIVDPRFFEILHTFSTKMVENYRNTLMKFSEATTAEEKAEEAAHFYNNIYTLVNYTYWVYSNSNNREVPAKKYDPSLRQVWYEIVTNDETQTIFKLKQLMEIFNEGGVTPDLAGGILQLLPKQFVSNLIPDKTKVPSLFPSEVSKTIVD